MSKYEKNPNPVKYFDEDKLSGIIQFLLETMHLNNIDRTGYADRKVRNGGRESVGEHTYSAALFGYVLAKMFRPDLNPDRIAVINLFHDVPEVGEIGDVTPYDKITLQQKEIGELDTIKHLTSLDQRLAQLKTIFEHSINREQPDVSFAYQCEILQMALQASIYKMQGYQQMEGILPYVEERLTDKNLKNVFREIKELCNKSDPFNQLTCCDHELLMYARNALTESYNPMTNFSVGCAIQARKNSDSKEYKIFTGTNVENSAFTPAICSERVAMAKANSEGYRNFESIVIAGAEDNKGKDQILAPCGVCRQMMYEFADGANINTRIVMTSSDLSKVVVSTIRDLLPLPFGPSNIDLDVSKYYSS